MRKSEELKKMYDFIMKNIQESNFYKNRDDIDFDDVIDRETFIDSCYCEVDKAINKFTASSEDIEYFEKFNTNVKESLIDAYIEEWDDEADLLNQLRYFYIYSLFFANLNDKVLKIYMKKDIEINQEIFK